MSKVNLSGWVALLIGTAVWVYGYFFTTGNSSLIEWKATSPWWIADFLPTMEFEIGMALVFASMIPIYWPNSSRKPDEAGAVITAAELDTASNEHNPQSLGVADQQTPGADQQSSGVTVMEIVREMIWNDPDVRRTYEALRARGLSVDDVVTELARAYVGCQWEPRGYFPELWSEALRVMREGHFNFSNGELFGHIAQPQRRDNGLENTQQIPRSKQT